MLKYFIYVLIAIECGFIGTLNFVAIEQKPHAFFYWIFLLKLALTLNPVCVVMFAIRMIRTVERPY